MRDIPKIPQEYKAEELKGCGYTKTTPRKWTQKEIAFIKDLKQKGYSNEEIAFSVDRSEVSVSIKLKRELKTNNLYNENHREQKYLINNQFLQEIKPITVLDCFAGCNPFYINIPGLEVFTNDINKDFNTDTHLDALKLLCSEYINGKKYDLIDLDPFGSAYDCLDLAIKMAKKGLCVTLGEMGQKRWHRLDYISTHYGINNYEDFTPENLIKHIQVIGKRNKKDLQVYTLENWPNISRVWFVIKPLKITEQWEVKQVKETALFNLELEFN